MDQQVALIIREVKRNSISESEILHAKDIPNEIGLDSLEIIEFLLELERTFDIRVNFDSFSLNEILTVSNICSYVQAQQRQKTDA